MLCKRDSFLLLGEDLLCFLLPAEYGWKEILVASDELFTCHYGSEDFRTNLLYIDLNLPSGTVYFFGKVDLLVTSIEKT